PSQKWLLIESRRFPLRSKAPIECWGDSFEELEFDDAALDPYHGGVGSVVGAQFGEDVFDSPFDGFLGDRELLRNLFVGIASGNQTQDSHFRRREGVISGMLSQLEGGFRGKSLFPCMHGTDRFQEFLMEETL